MNIVILGMGISIMKWRKKSLAGHKDNEMKKRIISRNKLNVALVFQSKLWNSDNYGYYTNYL